MALRSRPWIVPALMALAVLAARGVLQGQQAGQTEGQGRPSSDAESFRFRSGIDLVNVTATVTDSRGRFVPGLRQADFAVYEDGQPQKITHFSNERCR